MKILQVIQAFYPCQIWGGPPQNTLTLSKGLQQRGHTVQILTTNILDYEQRLNGKTFADTWEGIPVTYLHAYWYGRKKNSMGFIFSPDALRFYSSIKTADVVHIQGYRHFLFLFASLAAIRAKTPFILHARGTLTQQFGRSRLKQYFDNSIGRFIANRASGAVALNDQEINLYATLGVPKEKIVKILNPFDPANCPVLPDRDAFRQKYNISNTDKLVLFLSRLHHRKGIELLIRAIHHLNREDIKLCLVGPDHGYKETILELVSQLNLAQQTIITGPLYDEAKYEAYRAADVYVLPSIGGEGFPTTIMEACYSETPIVVTNTMEAANVVHEQVGLAVPYDMEKLSQAIVQIIDDQALTQKFRAASRLVLANHFELSSALDKFEALYAA